jgi:hypothetical protein
MHIVMYYTQISCSIYQYALVVIHVSPQDGSFSAMSMDIFLCTTAYYSTYVSLHNNLSYWTLYM